MTTPELLDALLERLPRLREQGVTHVSVDPTTGAVSMLIAPKAPEPTTDERAPQQRSTWDPTAIGLPSDTPEPRSFRERRTTAAPAVK